jgi:hypothetical protein
LKKPVFLQADPQVPKKPFFSTFPLFVPSLSWQNDRFQYQLLKKAFFAGESVPWELSVHGEEKCHFCDAIYV